MGRDDHHPSLHHKQFQEFWRCFVGHQLYRVDTPPPKLSNIVSTSPMGPETNRSIIYCSKLGKPKQVDDE